jgi:hypothetical protein
LDRFGGDIFARLELERAVPMGPGGKYTLTYEQMQVSKT